MLVNGYSRWPLLMPHCYSVAEVPALLLCIQLVLLICQGLLHRSSCCQTFCQLHGMQQRWARYTRGTLWPSGVPAQVCAMQHCSLHAVHGKPHHVIILYLASVCGVQLTCKPMLDNVRRSFPAVLLVLHAYQCCSSATHQILQGFRV